MGTAILAAGTPPIFFVGAIVRASPLPRIDRGAVPSEALGSLQVAAGRVLGYNVLRWSRGRARWPPCGVAGRSPCRVRSTTLTTPATTPTSALDLASVRQQFPSLALTAQERPVVYLDNPGGTQVPQACIDAMARYLTTSNANTHGAFLTSARTDEMLDDAHGGMADLLNAADPREIVFGPNMTTLTFAVSRAIGRTLQPGDELVVTMLDHDANVAPWLALEEERGAVVRVVDIEPTTCTLNMEDLRAKITARTKVVAVGYASNAVGTINDVATIVRWAREVGALSYIDAVQYAPHGPIDVQALGCDFLTCSAYKFFGSHQGIVYGRLALLESLPAYKVRPASDAAPGRWETGTQNHECLAGLVGTLDYLAALGRQSLDRFAARFPGMSGRRLELPVALAAIQEHERTLAERP